MTDEILRSHVKDLLERIERVFSTEWRKTKLNLDPDMIEHFVDPKGTFLHPESSTATIPWPSRDELLVSYRLLVQELHMPSASPAVATTATGVTKPVSVEVPGVVHVPPGSTIETVPPIQGAPPMVPPDLPIQQPPAHTPPPRLTTASIPRPEPSMRSGVNMMPRPGILPQWPGVMTAPIPIVPAGSSPVLPPIINQPPTGHDLQRPPISPVTGNPGAVQVESSVQRCIKKFAHLLNGVKYEVIRDFILAEATNTGMDKPTIIIYCNEDIWQEFAFVYEEGKRILYKYPQRDSELIDFIKVAGHSS